MQSALTGDQRAIAALDCRMGLEYGPQENGAGGLQECNQSIQETSAWGIIFRLVAFDQQTNSCNAFKYKELRVPLLLEQFENSVP